jgi:hypothetical protein
MVYLWARASKHQTTTIKQNNEMKGKGEAVKPVKGVFFFFLAKR